MEAIFSSETSVDTQRTTLRYIPEDDTRHKYMDITEMGCMWIEFSWLKEGPICGI
jgi:hypothetical protein